PGLWNISAAASAGDLYLGYSPRDNDYYKGALDDVAIYSRALTDEEIRQRYQGAGVSGVTTEGPHYISHYSVDIVGNKEQISTGTVIVDNTPPVTAVEFGAPYVLIDPPLDEVLAAAGMTAGDEGVSSIDKSYPDELKSQPYEMNISSVILSGATDYYNYSSSTFSASAAEMEFDYYGNPGVYLYEGAKVDIHYVRGETPVSLIAEDAWSGVKRSEYKIMNSGWLDYTGSVNFTGYADGIYMFYYRSYDNLGHIEGDKTLFAGVDNTAPSTELAVGGARFTVNGIGYISPDTKIILTSDDGEWGVGVKEIKWNVDGGAWEVWQGQALQLQEGIHTIRYYSVDNLGNTEQMKTQTFYVDAAAPETAMTIAQPMLETEEKTYITSASSIILTAEDDLSGVAATKWKLDDYNWLEYAQPFTLAGTTITEGGGIPAGCAAYWNFDEGEGNVLNDTSGKGNNGTIYGASWTEGKTGSALNFDGSNDVVKVPGMEDVCAGYKDFSVEFWMKTSVRHSGGVIAHGWWKGYGWYFRLDSAYWSNYGNVPLFFFLSNNGDRAYAAYA
ncbi:LamG domain-containing protein, partial [bacterium]|nr:LamG domain-containing protein [bacterium]